MKKKFKALVIEAPKPRQPFAVLAKKRKAGAHTSSKRTASKQRRELQREMDDVRGVPRGGSASTSACSRESWSMLSSLSRLGHGLSR